MKWGLASSISFSRDLHFRTRWSYVLWNSSAKRCSLACTNSKLVGPIVTVTSVIQSERKTIFMHRDHTAVAATPGATFTEGYVEADGFRIRYLEAGQGIPLIHLHGAGGLFLSPAHDLLSQTQRVIAFEMPGFGHSAPNHQETMAELAATMGRAISSLGINTFNLMGTSLGGKTALWLALQAPERVLAVVLEAPAAIRPEQAPPPSPSVAPEVMMRAFHAHPERFPSLPAPEPEMLEKTWPMVLRLLGPNRDAAFEEQLKSLTAPVLVLFGT